MKKRFLLLAATSLMCLAFGVTFVSNSSGLSFKNAKATTYNLTLNSDTEIEGLSSTPSNGTFSVRHITWNYNNAKTAESGLLTLVRTAVGNNFGDEAYLGNTYPITTLESMNIQFVGQYLTLYGSIDGTHFERVRTISSSTTVTDLSDYFYVRLCSGNQNGSDLTITSVGISYSCDNTKYQNDIRDSLFNAQTKIDTLSSEAIAEESNNVFDANRSVKALKFKQNIAYGDVTKYVWIKLNHTVSVSDTSRTKVVLHYSCDEGSMFESTDGKHTAKDNITLYMRFMQSDFKNKACNDTFTSPSIVANTAYKKLVIELNSHTFTGDFDVIRLNINRVITAGALYVDDVHIEESDNYPTVSYSYTYPVMNEENDLSNGTYTQCYSGSTDAGTETEFIAPSRAGGSSTQSRKTTLSADWKMWRYAGMDADFHNKSLTFDVLAADVTSGKSANLVLQIQVNGAVYKINNVLGASLNNGVTRETVMNGEQEWSRITIDPVLIISSAEETESTNIGFNLGYARTIYIDNIYIGSISIA